MAGLGKSILRLGILLPCSFLAVAFAAVGPAFGQQGQTPGAPALEPIEASYSAAMDRGLSVSGTATRILSRQEDGTWLYQFDVDSSVADIRESLRFRWNNGRVIPLKYRYTLKGFLIRNRSRAMNFNQVAGSVSGSFDGDRFTMDLEPGALDPLGFQLQLRQDLKAGKTRMEYAVADEGDYDHDQFAVIGTEIQSSPFGSLETVKVEKVRSGDSKRQTLMWFAPELDYLLVRLVQVEPDGSRYEVTLDDANIPGR